ncbi:carbonyl reductase [NADPH] 1-like [Biomphalaria glabrata]|uniref:carbonyl reductase (NADPH) n=1 Tax=Biomphalaria glabrata TaxID=6526 RepID=A0A9W3B693_BIOGL|nr:carbonyl reductase [NADPH] 1-like [Biomphalaria glabrata]
MSTKVAVVTGANKGLGFGIVRGLCKAFEGDVFLTARDEGRGRAAVAELEKEDLHPKFHLLDISDHDSIVKLKDFLQSNYGGLDLLVNNAAIAYEFNSVPSPPIGQAAEEVCKINYFGTLDVCQTLFPLLRPHARVCNVSSINCEFSLAECGEELKARIRNPDLTIDDVTALVNEFIEAAKNNQLKEKGFDTSPYGISKIGVSLITHIQQKQLDESGAQDIVVNCCDVGLVSTDMTGGAGMPIDLGTMTPLYCCLLPPDVESPRGKFIMNKRTYDWLNN